MFNFRRRHKLQTQPLFITGEVKLSEKVQWLAARDLVEPLLLVLRHLSGDWGNVDVAGRQANAQGLKGKGVIISRYQITPRLEVLVSPSEDRRRTVVKLPEEHWTFRRGVIW